MRNLTRRRFMEGLACAGAANIGTGLFAKTNSVIHSTAHCMPICVFSKHFQWLDYKGMAQTAAEIGFDGIDLTVRPGGHVSPDHVNDELPEAVEAVEKAGLKVLMMTTAITDARDKTTEQILRTARRLGIRYYRLGYYRYDLSRNIETQLNEVKARLRDLEALNQSYGMHGAYQNHAGSNYAGAPLWDLWYMLEDTDPRWLGCQYDIRHATVESALAWPLTFQLLKSRIQLIVVKDFEWRKNGKWQPVNCPLGKGAVDFDAYATLVKEAGISGPVSMHYEYPLGGAGKGSRTLSITRDEFVGAMKRDLKVLTSLLL